MCRQVRTYADGTREELFPGFNVKALLVPDNDEEVFWNLDIKGAEIRVLCFESGDKSLTDAVNAGADVHTVFLTKVKHPDMEADLTNPEFLRLYTEYKALHKTGDKDITELRDAIKRSIFGTLYGARAKKISEQLGDTSPEGIRFAQEVIDSIFKAFPTIKDYITRTERDVDTNGEVITVFGRHRRFPLARASSYLNAKAKREGVNFKIQSTSSDLVVIALCEVDEHAHEIEAEVKLSVHDSIAGTIKKRAVPRMKAFFDKYVVDGTRIRCPWLPVPWLYDLEIGPSYGEKLPYMEYLIQNNMELCV